MFYWNVRDDAALNEKYGFFLFVFAWISTGMLVALLLSFVVSAQPGRAASKTQNAPFGTVLKTMLGLQMILEDIPQFILGALVRSERGIITPYLVFTWTTSGLNFLLNLLDMIEIENDGTDDDATDEGYGKDGVGESKSEDPYEEYERQHGTDVHLY